uniref:Uncharacterized protein n=1 Tax=Ditylenchus dipsaci TaxID=166011 RepID=A0A915CPG3_9BILA
MIAQKFLKFIFYFALFAIVNADWDFEKVREYWKILPPHVSDLPKQPSHLPTCKQGAPCGGSPPGAPRGLGLGFYPWGSKQTPCVCPT